jgi:hypothetical protein
MTSHLLDLNGTCACLGLRLLVNSTCSKKLFYKNRTKKLIFTKQIAGSRRHAHKQPRLEIVANFELKVAIFQRFPLAKSEEAATKPTLDLPNVPLFADHSVLDYGICVWRRELAACLHSVTDVHTTPTHIKDFPHQLLEH